MSQILNILGGDFPRLNIMMLGICISKEIMQFDGGSLTSRR